MINTDNPYLLQCKRNLPRLLGIFSCDKTSPAYGMGDRYYWAWGLTDFGNGTFQGAVNGLSCLWKNDLWPYATPKDDFISRIKALFSGTAALIRKDGSLEEAFPHEGSFCVTSLVAFDLLCTLDSLEQDVDDAVIERWKETIAALIGFIINADETHALISNHLATAVAALVRWYRLTGEPKAQNKAEILLRRIIDNQSAEGWFVEYQGADPGYQTVCMYYLADVHHNTDAFELHDALTSSVRFLWHFAHPDGSFGGIYGSRCTRFYNPAGIEALAGEIPEAHALAQFMAASIAENRVVALDSIDEPNLIPWFNAYAQSAELYEKRKKRQPASLCVPCRQESCMRKNFKEAGLTVDRGPGYYTIINTHKGGVVQHFRAEKCVIADAGVAITDTRRRFASTQAYNPNNQVAYDENMIVVKADFSGMTRRLATPALFLILRFLCCTAFRFPSLREMAKLMMVRLLITRRNTLQGGNARHIMLGSDLHIDDKYELPAGFRLIEDAGAFVPIHMASQGYWQLQDEGI